MTNPVRKLNHSSVGGGGGKTEKGPPDKAAGPPSGEGSNMGEDKSRSTFYSSLVGYTTFLLLILFLSLFI